MFDFVRVEGGAPYFPHTCRFCHSAKDLLDTSSEDHVGRLYVCRMCVERGARVFGMIAGSRHQELMQADTSLRRTEAALAEAQERLRIQELQLADYEEIAKAQDERLGTAQQRIQQLEDATRARAEEELALVGAGMPNPTIITRLPNPSEIGTGLPNWDVKHTYPNPHLNREEHHGSEEVRHGGGDGNEETSGETPVDPQAQHDQEDRRDRSGEGDPED